MKFFAGRVTRENALVYDVRVVLNDEHRYFIIKVPSVKRSAFLQAVEKDKGFRMEDYGDILHRGWDEPEDDLKEILRVQYGLPYPEVPASATEA